MPSTRSSGRTRGHPNLGLEGPDTRGVAEALARLVERLQVGWDNHAADITDAILARDVLWEGRSARTVLGHDELHEIHLRLKQKSVGGPSSRFEVVQSACVAQDVVVAHVRRRAIDAEVHALAPSQETTGAFSEMALYVL